LIMALFRPLQLLARRARCASSKAQGGLTPSQLWHFDTFGYVVLRNVIPAGEIEAANAAIDAHPQDFRRRGGVTALATREAFRDGGDGRLDCGRMFEWKAPHCDPFRRFLCHPGVVPAVTDLVGPGFRLDHAPLCFIHRKGGEGHDLHGGACKADGTWYHELAYEYKKGPYCRLLSASVALTSTTSPEDGGFIIVPGSHKSNLPTPDSMEDCQGEWAEVMHRPVINTGDVLLFTEAATHGTEPWTREQERRVVLYRFAPATCAYGRAYLDRPEYEGLTEAQAAVLQPPHHARLDRNKVVVGSDGDVEVKLVERDAEKKAFDRSVFGTDFF